MVVASQVKRRSQVEAPSQHRLEPAQTAAATALAQEPSPHSQMPRLVPALWVVSPAAKTLATSATGLASMKTETAAAVEVASRRAPFLRLSS